MKYQQLLVSTLLILMISSCSKKIVYVPVPCPELIQYDVGPLDLNISYEVYDDKS